MAGIQYYLRENKLVKGAKTYFAQVVARETITFKTLVREIVETGSTLTETDVRAVLGALAQVLAKHLGRGRKVVTPFCNFGAQIKGNFSSLSDVYDKSRHEIVGTTTCGVELKKLIVAQAQTVKIDSNRKLPQIDEVIDHATDVTNQTLTNGGTAELVGQRMKFDKHDPEQGVFIVQAGQEDIRAPIYAMIGDKKVIFSIPELPTGAELQVEVRTRPAENKEVLVERLSDVNLKAA